MISSKDSIYQIQLKSVQRKLSAIEKKHLTKQETLSMLVYMYDKGLKELALDVANLNDNCEY